MNYCYQEYDGNNSRQLVKERHRSQVREDKCERNYSYESRKRVGFEINSCEKPDGIA